MTRGPKETAELMAAHGLEPKRALGQNFLIDPNTVDRIVRLSGTAAGDRVVEVGPGLGAMTSALAEIADEVVAVELDDTLAAIVAEQTRDLGVRVVNADAMTVRWDDVCPGSPWRMVANLPYNVGTPLVLDVLDGVPQVTDLTVMLQREVAERLAATVGSDNYGIPSVKVAYWATAEVVARVPASVFLPRPRVESAVVRIVRRSAPAVEGDPAVLFSLVKQAFGQRRKMLRKSLGGRVDAAAFAAADVKPESRPEELDVADWGRLTQAIQ